MVLTHHGHEISIRETLAECATGRAGDSAGALARAARRLGLSAKGHLTEECRFDEIHLPAIAHWGSDHFVVVETVGTRWVSLVDPRFGRRRITHEELWAGLGQEVIELWPRADFVKRRSGEDPFWRTYLRSLLRLPGTRSRSAA
jgi:ABC-type bacteriocin/lantibiotic exporter with double-glycine peptidase domain